MKEIFDFHKMRKHKRWKDSYSDMFNQIQCLVKTKKENPTYPNKTNKIIELADKYERNLKNFWDGNKFSNNTKINTVVLKLDKIRPEEVKMREWVDVAMLCGQLPKINTTRPKEIRQYANIFDKLKKHENILGATMLLGYAVAASQGVIPSLVDSKHFNKVLTFYTPDGHLKINYLKKRENIPNWLPCSKRYRPRIMKEFHEKIGIERLKNDKHKLEDALEIYGRTTRANAFNMRHEQALEKKVNHNYFRKLLKFVQITNPAWHKNLICLFAKDAEYHRSLLSPEIERLGIEGEEIYFKLNRNGQDTTNNPLHESYWTGFLRKDVSFYYLATNLEL